MSIPAEEDFWEGVGGGTGWEEGDQGKDCLCFVVEFGISPS